MSDSPGDSAVPSPERQPVDVDARGEPGHTEAQSRAAEVKAVVPGVRVPLAEGGFTSTIAWENEQADCLVVMCSDHRFRRQALEFVQSLGYQNPHVLSLPGGVAIMHSMVAAIGFLSKAAGRLVAKALELTGARDVICIAHEDCGAYKAGKVELVGKVTRRLAGSSLQEIQRDHLLKAARTIQFSLDGVNVRTFYADVVGEDSRVHFSEVVLPAGRQRRRAL